MKLRFLCAFVLAVLFIAVSAARAADCQKLSEACVEGPQTRDIGGYPVYRDCWRTRSQFSCASQTLTDDCQSLRDRGCGQVGSRCVDTNAQGSCMLYEQSWQCRVASGSTSTITHCGNQQFCLDGQCFNTAYAPDPDFARVVTGLEVQREAGRYVDPNTLVVFQGYDNRCKKLSGLVNCCKGGGTDGSLINNMNLALGAGGQAMGVLGSSYAYDALFTSDAPDLVIAGFEALFGAGGGSSALAGLIAGDLSVASFVEFLVPGPWTLIMLAIQLSGILTCEQPEQILAMKRDNRLCHGVGSYCSARIPIIRTCIETTESYCCFNSRLARILNEQGRAQLGRGWGTPTSPDCSGFTVAQLQGLDFSRMNLSEFYAEIAPTLPAAGGIRNRAQQKIESYFPAMTLKFLRLQHLIVALLCTLPAAPALAADRIQVTSVRPLLTRAIDAGTAHGVIVGETATVARQRFDTSAPIEVDVRTVKSLNEPGCSRLEITTRQANVLDKSKREDKHLTYEINYCRDGRTPGTQSP